MPVRNKIQRCYVIQFLNMCDKYENVCIRYVLRRAQYTTQNLFTENPQALLSEREWKFSILLIFFFPQNSNHFSEVVWSLLLSVQL